MKNIAQNPITGDELKTGAASAEYLANFNQINFDKKPIVHYKGDALVRIGHGTWILPIDHPSALVENETPNLTSKVIYIDKRTGDFETMNTRYRKVQDNA